LGFAGRRAVAGFAKELGVWAKRIAELEALAIKLQSSRGERGMVEALAWVRTEVRKGGTKGTEGARALGYLQSMALNASEARAPRGRALAHA